MPNEQRTLPNLARRRQHIFLTQEELAEKAGVSRLTIVRLEGGAFASLKTIRRLAAALGCEPTDLTPPE